MKLKKIFFRDDYHPAACSFRLILVNDDATERQIIAKLKKHLKQEGQLREGFIYAGIAEEKFVNGI